MKLVGETKKSGVRLYRSRGDRKRAVTHLRRLGRNYFVGFVDSDQDCPHGLTYGWADWVGLFPYVKDV